MRLKIHSQYGQSTVEYIILVTAVVMVAIAFLTANTDVSFRGKLNGTLKKTSDYMGNLSKRYTRSIEVPPGPEEPVVLRVNTPSGGVADGVCLPSQTWDPVINGCRKP